MTVVAVIPETSAPASRETRPAPPVRQILFPSDLSDESHRAFHHARLLGELREFQASEIARWARVIKAANIRLD